MERKKGFKNFFKTKLGIFILIVGSFFFINILFSALNPFFEEVSGVGRVSVIKIHDVISIDSSIFGGVSSDQILNELRNANQDSSIKAIVLDINSPGGGPVASDDVRRYVKKIDKPVITIIREIGASGAYWISSSTDYIIASDLSLVGSVGVIASFLSFEDLFKEYGISYNRYVSAERKDLFSQYRNRTVEEDESIQKLVDSLFQKFLSTVRDERGLSNFQVSEISDGDVFLGNEALRLGLIDEVGGYDSVEVWLKKELGINEVKYIVNDRGFSFVDILGLSFSTSKSFLSLS